MKTEAMRWTPGQITVGQDNATVMVALAQLVSSAPERAKTNVLIAKKMTPTSSKKAKTVPTNASTKSAHVPMVRAQLVPLALKMETPNVLHVLRTMAMSKRVKSVFAMMPEAISRKGANVSRSNAHAATMVRMLWAPLAPHTQPLYVQSAHLQAMSCKLESVSARLQAMSRLLGTVLARLQAMSWIQRLATVCAPLQAMSRAAALVIARLKAMP